jgi:tetratricopeptide (TPR) repeat protein
VCFYDFANISIFLFSHVACLFFSSFQRIAALRKMTRHEGAEETGEADEQTIIAYSLYDVGHMLSCTFFASQQRDIDSDVVSRDISQSLAAFADAKKMFEEIPRPMNTDEGTVLEDPALARARQIPEIFEEMLQSMAVLSRETGQEEKALELYSELLSLHKSSAADSGDASDDASYLSVESSKFCREEKVAQAIEDIAATLRDQDDTQRALENYTEALEIRKSIDEYGLSVAKTLRLIGRLHLQRKEWELSILRLEEELKILINLLDENTPSIAYCYHSIGKAYEGKEDFRQALGYFERARKAFGNAASAESDIEFTHIMFDTGNILLQMSKESNLEGNDLELALTCLKQAFEGYKTFYGETCVEVANTLFLQGELFYSHEDYATAINCFEEALRVYRLSLGEEENIKVARTLNLIGLCHLESGTDEDYAMDCFDAW